MTSTQDLLGVIAALRQRLDQAQSLASNVGAVAASALDRPGADALEGLRKQVTAGNKDQQLLQLALQKIGRTDAGAGTTELPSHLTARAVRLLQQTRALIQQLKKFTGETLLQDEAHPTALHYQDSVLLADLVLRTIQTLPEKPSLQLRLCSGVDVLLGIIQQRVGTLKAIVRDHEVEEQQLEELAGLLHQLHRGTLADINPFFALAEALVQEAAAGQPLAWTTPPAHEPARHIAGHCLTTARVITRVAREDAHWRSSLLQPVVAALVHDAGMLSIPATLLTQASALDASQRGELEHHCREGAKRLEAHSRAHPWLLEAAGHHHERLDGTGYPAGLSDVQISPLVRLLAVCDVYTALASPRPHRAAVDTRAALKETSDLAQRGLLDRNYARLLLRLTHYPAGTAVELNDGACGVVIKGEEVGTDDTRPSRPVVAVLTGREGKALPQPQLLDLAACDGRHVQRGLPAAEREKVFGICYPQYI